MKCMIRCAQALLFLILAAGPQAGCSAGETDRPGSAAEEEAIDVGRSSWIERATFNRDEGGDSGRLAVTIKGEDITYLDVPVSVWREFKNADSLGAYYTKNIRTRYERVKGESIGQRFGVIEGRTATANVECAFNEECEPMILRGIELARESIRMAAYAFTRTRIASALVDAKRRGVDVQIKMDAQQAEYPSAVRLLEYLKERGISVTLISVKGDFSAMHNKFLVIDKRYVITGSHNFTTTAGSANWENMLFVDSPVIAARYAEAWQTIVSE